MSNEFINESVSAGMPIFPRWNHLHMLSDLPTYQIKHFWIMLLEAVSTEFELEP